MSVSTFFQCLSAHEDARLAAELAARIVRTEPAKSR